MSMELIQKYYNLKKIFKRVEKIDFLDFIYDFSFYKL